MFSPNFMAKDMSKMRTAAKMAPQAYPRPPIKWAGGKGQLLAQFAALFPKTFGTYHEPFLGGGAVFFRLNPSRAVLMDNNSELMGFYLAVRDDLDALLENLEVHRNEEAYYYAMRGTDPATLSPVERASRFLYLNKTSFNGLWRVNRCGQHNVPFGRYKNPKYADVHNLRLVSDALRHAQINCSDFCLAIERVGKGDFVYLDPPYHPLSATANFTSYSAASFGAADQERLATMFRRMTQKGCLVMLSNSDTPFIRKLYQGYNVRTVRARRAINCRGAGRGPVSELVIRNYE